MPSKPFEQVLSGAAFARRAFGACEWNNRIIISGGLSTSGATLNDVWESYDGINWKRLATGNYSFSARSSHTMLVFNNRLYVVGGYSDSAYKSDVWSSPDGVTWDQVKAIAFTPARDDLSAFVVDNRLFVTGGDAGGAPMTDIWMTPNGTNWTRLITGYTRMQRTVAMPVVYNNRAIIIGGYNGSARLSTAISSANGRDWDITGSSCGLPAFDDTKAEVFDNKIVIAGGYNGAAMSTIYYSQDGTTFKLGNANMGFSVYQNQLVALKNPNRLFLLFGYTGSAVRTDVWMSTGSFQSA